MNKIFDCFTFYDELELLELRLHELHNCVDLFVILEGERTYQNKEKKSVYLENKHKFSAFNHKIIHLTYPTEYYSDNVWVNEAGQMNFVNQIYDRMDKDDIVMLSNIDEIPRPEIISKNYLNFLLKENKKIVLEMIQFYWYYNTVFHYDKKLIDMGYKLSMNGIGFHGTRIGKKKDLEREFPYEWFKDKSEENLYLTNAGWHFSFVGKGDNAVNKVTSYAHDNFKEVTENTFDERRKILSDPVGRDELVKFYGYYPLDLLPDYIKKNMYKFMHNIINQI